MLFYQANFLIEILLFCIIQSSLVHQKHFQCPVSPICPQPIICTRQQINGVQPVLGVFCFRFIYRKIVYSTKWWYGRLGVLLCCRRRPFSRHTGSRNNNKLFVLPCTYRARGAVHQQHLPSYGRVIMGFYIVLYITIPSSVYW